MGALGATEAQRILNDSLRKAESTYTLALYLTNPTKDNSGTEASGGVYVRQSITFAAPSEVSGKQQVSNSSEIDFGVQTTALGTIGYWAVYENGTTFKWFGAFSTPKIFEIGDAIQIDIGEVDCILS